jgi:hypothetical protein
MPKNPPIVTTPPTTAAPSGDGFFDSSSVVPPAEQLPEPAAVGSAVGGAGDAPPVVGVPAPDLQPPAAPPVPGDGKRTPAEWAAELGHVDATVREGAMRPLSASKAWIFRTVKQHTGWGSSLPIDIRLTREEYEGAVAEALGLTVGGKPGATPERKWQGQAAVDHAAQALLANVAFADEGEAALDDLIAKGRVAPERRSALLGKARANGAKWIREIGDFLDLANDESLNALVRGGK